MLSFFRRYQKIIFIFTTLLVVISFVFFGTYKAIAPVFTKQGNDKVLYTTLKGRKITQDYLEKMERFLEVEPAFSYDPLRVIQSNPLNDGVIAREFLVQGFADLLFSDEDRALLENKNLKERSFSLYNHPTSKKLSTQATWESFAPELEEQFWRFKKCEDVLSAEAIETRSALYLTHQRFNGDMLKQVLRYQEYQQRAVIDPLLVNKDLSLFGYRNLSDWFGELFVERAAKVIIEGAQLAKVAGLKVARDEVYADIYERAESSFRSLQQRTEIPVQNGAEFLKLLLNRLQMEEKDLVQIWEDVLYFRRLLDERSSSVMIDSLALGKFYRFANHTLNLKVTELAKDLHFSNFEDLKGFELYLESVGERREDLLTLPSRYKSPENLAIEAPELTGRRFWINVAHLNKKELSAKVPLTLLWKWQEEHYQELQELFGLPVFAQFDAIDERLRERVDHYSYTLLIDEHPEWIGEVLATKSKEPQEIFLRFNQRESSFVGIDDLAALSIRLHREDLITAYSQDEQNYYMIEVVQRGLLGEVLSYSEAKKSGALTELMERKEGDLLVERVLSAVRTSLEKNGVVLPKEGIEKFCIERRFYSYLQKVKGDTNYREGFDVNYAPQSRYKSIGRQEEGFQEALQLKKGSGYFAWNKERGLYFYEVESDLSETGVPLERLYMMHQLASKDLRRELIKEIVATL